jgi:hypothetical protein
VPDAEVQAALAHWGPRLIQNGVDYNDLMTTMARIDTWDQWLPEWSRTADVQAAFAQEADAAGEGDFPGRVRLLPRGQSRGVEPAVTGPPGDRRLDGR